MHRQSLVKSESVTLPHISPFGKITSHFIFAPIKHGEFKLLQMVGYFPKADLEKTELKDGLRWPSGLRRQFSLDRGRGRSWVQTPAMTNI